MDMPAVRLYDDDDDDDVDYGVGHRWVVGKKGCCVAVLNFLIG